MDTRVIPRYPELGYCGISGREHMMSLNDTKDRNINIRASGNQVQLIDRAAALRRTSRSDFMLDAATRMAEDVLLDSSVFTMPADEWDAYLATIESPPAPTAALRSLLRKPAPWDEG